MKYPMKVDDALVYERLVARVYQLDIQSGTASRREKDLYKEKLAWIKELRDLQIEGFEWTDADGNAWGRARDEDVEEKVRGDEIANIDCNVHDYDVDYWQSRS